MNTNKHSKKLCICHYLFKRIIRQYFFSSSFSDAPDNFCSRTTAVYYRRSKCTSQAKWLFKILTSVSAGTPVTRTGSKGNWIAVKVDGVRGYIYKTYLKRSKKASASSANSTSYRAVITASSVNMRAKPSFSGRIKGSLSAGQSVTVCTTKGAWKK